MATLRNVFTQGKGQLVIIQTDAPQSPLPIFNEFLRSASKEQQSIIIFSQSTPLTAFEIPTHAVKLDWTDNVPGFTSWRDPRTHIQNAVRAVSSAKPLLLLLSDLDDLSLDLQSPSQTYKFLRSLLPLLPSNTRLVVPLSSTSPLIPFLTPPTFLSNASNPMGLVHLILHSPSLVRHLAYSYLTPPPPLAPSPERFWTLFGPASQRGEGQRLSFESLYGSGSSINGVSNDDDEDDPTTFGIVEVLTRTAGGRKGIERALEGWRLIPTPEEDGDGVDRVEAVEWMELPSLRSITLKAPTQPGGGTEIVSSKPRTTVPASTDPTDPAAGLSFNLSLTDAQAVARASVPLPYAHENPDGGQIVYEPDSADDLDEDDPDEDLDI